MNRALAGDVGAFSALVDAYQGRVRAYVGTYLRWPDVVDDVAQEVFLDAYRTLASFRGEAPFSVWILGIARHRVLRHLRSSLRRERTFEALLAARVDERIAADVENAAGSHEIVRALRRCLEGLPDRNSRLVRGHYFEGRSLAELARALGLTDVAARVALLRVRQSLRACVEHRLAEGAS